MYNILNLLNKNVTVILTIMDDPLHALRQMEIEGSLSSSNPNSPNFILSPSGGTVPITERHLPLYEQEIIKEKNRRTVNLKKIGSTFNRIDSKSSKNNIIAKLDPEAEEALKNQEKNLKKKFVGTLFPYDSSFTGRPLTAGNTRLKSNERPR